MAGNKLGAQKAKATIIEKHGKDFYGKIGAIGGKSATKPKGFAYAKLHYLPTDKRHPSRAGSKRSKR